MARTIAVTYDPTGAAPPTNTISFTAGEDIRLSWTPLSTFNMSAVGTRQIWSDTPSTGLEVNNTDRTAISLSVGTFYTPLTAADTLEWETSLHHGRLWIDTSGDKKIAAIVKASVTANPAATGTLPELPDYPVSFAEIQGAVEENAALVAYIAANGGGGAWGTITGTLSDQTDLQAALDAIVAGNVTWGGIGGTLANQTDLNTALGLKLASATAASTYQPLDAALTALAAGSDFVQFTGPTTSTKVFTLPNVAGTIPVVGGNNTWTGVNTFNNESYFDYDDNGLIILKQNVTGRLTLNLTTSLTSSITASIPGGNSNYTLAALGISQTWTGTQNFTGATVTVATPATSSEAANKSYVDAVAQGQDVKASCRAATTANITLSGAQTIDGVSVIANDRVIVKNQSTASQNGIYVAASGSWSRSTDADASAEVTSGLFTFVSEGTVNGGTGWTLTTADPITVGSTSLTFTQFSGAGSYTAGTGLTLTGTQFSISASYVGQNTITTLGTIATGVWQGTTVAIGYGGTGLTSYTLGDIIYCSATNVLAKLAGNTSTALKVLTQTGTGSASAAPVWVTAQATYAADTLVLRNSGGVSQSTNWTTPIGSTASSAGSTSLSASSFRIQRLTGRRRTRTRCRLCRG